MYYVCLSLRSPDRVRGSSLGSRGTWVEKACLWLTLARTDRQPESVSETILAYQRGVISAPLPVHYLLPHSSKKGRVQFLDLLATLPADLTKSDVSKS